jgi:hypothetical protein
MLGRVEKVKSPLGLGVVPQSGAGSGLTRADSVSRREVDRNAGLRARALKQADH